MRKTNIMIKSRRLNSQRHAYQGISVLCQSFAALVYFMSVTSCKQPHDDKGQATPSSNSPSQLSPDPPPSAGTPSSAGVSSPLAPSRQRRDIVCATGLAVSFSDPALEVEVRRKLQKLNGPITQKDLKTVRSVNLSQGAVNVLDPCVFVSLTALKELFLGPGDLTDLSPLAQLVNLESLRASANKVSDVRPLEKLTKLDRLDLGRTGVRDIKPLATLSNLTELQLDDTEVSDITPLSGCTKLERLSLKRTLVKDLSPLKDHKKLKFLYLEGSAVDNTSPLGPLVSRGLRIIKLELSLARRLRRCNEG